MTAQNRKVHIVVSNPYERGLDERFWRPVEKGRLERWPVTSKFEKGDLALFYFTTPVKAIVAVGVVATEPVYQPSRRWDEAPQTLCSFEPVVKLENPIRLEDCEDLPKKMTVRGTGLVAGENVEGLMGKVARFNPAALISLAPTRTGELTKLSE